MASYLRTNYLVLPSYQVRLAIVLIVVLALGSVLHGFCLYQLTARRVQDGFLAAHNRLRSTWDVLKPAIIVTNGASFLLLSLSLLLAVVLVSHRLVGPLFKVQSRIAALAQGRFDLPALKLRQGDEGQALADQVNALQAGLHARLSRLRALARQLGRDPAGYSANTVRNAIEGCLEGLELDAPRPAPVGEESAGPGTVPPPETPAASAG